MRTDENQDLTTKPSDTLNRLRALFDAAVELSPAAREAWLLAHVDDDDERAAIQRLLAADEKHGFLDTPASEHAARLDAEEIKPEGLIGQRIGEFRLVRALGQGGMAAVFLGERIGKDFVQRAAIKLLRRGLYSELEQRLFLRERQVLAALDHPNIARLIDGGVTDAGVPYLVLEFVDGVPITRYADEHRLDVAQRLVLFFAVCRAVESAHRRLIVHRDIKPSNILVTEPGGVKLLDFGIAKLIEEDTEAASGGTLGVFTPDYAAPEQVHGGAITTATDVYGLGVLLHELLLGLKPDNSPTAGSGPRRPSSRINEIGAKQTAGISPILAPEQLRRLLRGDLDNIVLKALESEPERRYASAGAFADDIERYLNGRPVIAHPPTRWYKTRKFIQRHRGGVTVTAILVLAIFAALSLALWQARVARLEATRARTEAAKAKQVADFVTRMLASIDPNRAKTMDRSLLRLMLDSAAKNAEHELAAQPAVLASVEEAISASYYSIGEFNLADAQLQSSLANAISGDIDVGTYARLTVRHADTLEELGRYQEAHEVAEQAMALAVKLPEDDHDRLLVETSLGEQDCLLFRRQACRERLTKVYAIERRVFGESAPETLRALAGLASSHFAPGHYAEGRVLAGELVARYRDRYGDEDSRTLAAIKGLAIMDLNVDAYAEAEAEKLLAANLPVAERVLGSEHPMTVETTFWLGEALYRQKRYAEAKPLLERSFALYTRINGPNHFQTLSAEISLTRTLKNTGDLDAAEQHARGLIAKMRAMPNGHGDHGVSQALLAEVFIRQKRYAEAENELNEAYAVQTQGTQHGGDEPPDIVNDYVELYNAWGKPDLAHSWQAKLPADLPAKSPPH